MDDKPFETMNVIPFVDIMLVLLTIVLVTSSFIVSGRIPVNLPEASKNIAQADTASVIELGQSGAIYFNGESVTLEGLKANLQPLGQETSFVIRADRDVALQHFIDVVDLLKQMSFQKVAVQTKNRT
ncbi:biopolymer transporter ExbD [Sporomusa sp. KB1]|jgi:biopolymer transport protein ExbD|uniref:ExbD/TolR family protein n=1 Tax=Sporomusa sp. KB1 TaxID=943346 RepID=UPI0011A8EED4|nr:biopolymer transporter ExbD [Sporomusa sp. KB1]TWH45069.1 biopolymer transport protein ExbD [Sporomusa sp. KB1]